MDGRGSMNFILHFNCFTNDPKINGLHLEIPWPSWTFIYPANEETYVGAARVH
jgi:hypothetical protein